MFSSFCQFSGLCTCSLYLEHSTPNYLKLISFSSRSSNESSSETFSHKSPCKWCLIYSVHEQKWVEVSQRLKWLRYLAHVYQAVPQNDVTARAKAELESLYIEHRREGPMVRIFSQLQFSLSVTAAKLCSWNGWVLLGFSCFFLMTLDALLLW